jgi:hypothetical protein
MAAKLIRLTHKIAIQLHLVAESLPLTVLAPGGNSGNFWIHPHICEITVGTPHRETVCPSRALNLATIKASVQEDA